MRSRNLSASETSDREDHIPEIEDVGATDQIANSNDRIADLSEFTIKAGQFWSACNPQEIIKAGNSQSALVSLVAKRYRLPREVASRQVKAFVAALK